MLIPERKRLQSLNTWQRLLLGPLWQSNQISMASPKGKCRAKAVGLYIGTDLPDVNYVSLMLQVRRCSYKLFLIYKLDAFDGQKRLFGGVNSLQEFSTQKMNIYTIQSEERHPKDYFWTNISHQESLFKESYSICLFFHQKSCN